MGADNIGHVLENLRQTFGVVKLIDIVDISRTLLFGFGVTDVVNIEAQRAGQVVEPVESEII
jgi:hypothetical protein